MGVSRIWLEGELRKIQTLEGPAGPPGTPGTPGSPGTPGAPGATGPPGTTTWAGISDKPATFTPATHSSTSHSEGYEPGNSNIQTHVTAAHAPAGAQANADITKAEIEAKLTGTISSHAHTGGSGDVVGPASATGDNIAVFNLTTGKLIKDGGATIASKENAGVAASAGSAHAALATGVHGSGANTIVYSNDAKLSDARTPLTHSHAPGDVTGTAVVTADARLSDARVPVIHDSTKHSVTYALPADITTHAALKTGAHGMLNSVMIRPQVTPTAKTAAVTLTIAELLTGIITGNPAAAVAYTLPTGTLCDAGMTIAVDEAFDWTLINIATTATYIITLTAGTAHTIVGCAKVPSNSTTTGGLWGTSQAMYRTRKTATNTFVTYRIG